MRTLKIVLAYDGGGFVGWQRQPAGTSIQGLLEGAITTIEGRPVTVVGAGRTDAGVHALGQVASCVLSHPIPSGTLARALNAVLPDAVRVLEVAEASEGFHARYSARSKTYRYLIHDGGPPGPFARGYAWHVSAALDEVSMSKAARLLEGEHDFSALQGAGSSPATTVRTMTDVRVWTCAVPDAFGRLLAGPAVRDGGRVVAVELSGNGFLRHMVRNAVGTLVEVGLGRRDAGWVGDVLNSGSRDLAGPTAPPHGLYLVSVEY